MVSYGLGLGLGPTPLTPTHTPTPHCLYVYRRRTYTEQLNNAVTAAVAGYLPWQSGRKTNNSATEPPQALVSLCIIYRHAAGRLIDGSE